MPEDTDPTEQTITETPTEARRPADDDGTLREEGRRAIEAERQNARKADKRAKELEDELARLREATASDAEKVLLAARREERAKADAEWQVRYDEVDARRRQALIVAEIKSAAAGQFIDAGDVVMMLAGSEDITLDEHDRVKGVEKALRALAEAKPHWVRREAGTANYGAPAAGRSLGQPAPDRQSLVNDYANQMRATGAYRRY